jgi:hypothetical protein
MSATHWTQLQRSIRTRREKTHDALRADAQLIRHRWQESHGAEWYLEPESQRLCQVLLGQDSDAHR